MNHHVAFVEAPGDEVDEACEEGADEVGRYGAELLAHGRGVWVDGPWLV